MFQRMGEKVIKMRDNIVACQIVDTLYTLVAENVTEDICVKCPVIRAIRDLRDNVKDANYEKTITELGLSFPNMRCPCDKIGSK